MGRLDLFTTVGSGSDGSGDVDHTRRLLVAGIGEHGGADVGQGRFRRRGGPRDALEVVAGSARRGLVDGVLGAPGGGFYRRQIKGGMAAADGDRRSGMNTVILGRPWPNKGVREMRHKIMVRLG